MSGVAIVNQLIFVFNTCILGIIAGASIFGAQFFGSRDDKGLKGSFCFRIITCVALTAAALALFCFWGENLIGLFLHSENQAELSQTLSLSKSYLAIILISLLPSALTQVYASTAKDTGKTVLPMFASVTAVLLNTLLNYILIFGKLGVPALGVKGAAIATVIAFHFSLSLVDSPRRTHWQSSCALDFLPCRALGLPAPTTALWRAHS